MSENKIKLSLRDRMNLAVQRFLGRVTFPIWGPFLVAAMRFIGGYRIQHLRQIRKRYLDLLKENKGPVLICANHLTLIDSAIITWSMASTWSHICSFKFFSWNLPERATISKNKLIQLICFLSRCIPVDRLGDRSVVKHSMDKLAYMLEKGDMVTIFPEGGRSRTGSVDVENFAYGVGQLVKRVKNCKVLCIYLRGINQKEFSDVPQRGERFYLDMRLFKPETSHAGLRATRDIATQIISNLVVLEQRYFEASATHFDPAAANPAG